MKEQYRKYVLISIILIMGVILFFKFTPFLGGILGAATIYLMVRKQMIYLTRKKKWKRGLAAIVLLFEVILIVLIPLTVFVWLIVNKMQGMNLDPNTIILGIEHVVDLIQQKTGYNLLSMSNLNLSSILSSVPRIGQNVMSYISGFALNIFMLIFILYFMLIGGTGMESYVSELLPFNESNKKEILKEMNMIVKSNAIGIPLLALIQGSIAFAGYWIFGVPNPFLFGFLTCFATIIPMVGTALIWLPLVIYLALTGDWGNAIGLTAYSLLVITNIDNLIRFLLQKKMADIHPLITIFGVMIGLPLFGFMGVIFGPLLISMFLLCVNIFKKEYLNDKEESGFNANNKIN